MFKRRSSQSELVDRPGVGEAFSRRIYRHMVRLNRFVGGIKMVRKFVAAEAARLGAGRALRVLDIGAGSADIPVAVAKWARRRGLDVEFACLEINPYAAQMARERIARSAQRNIRLVEEDVFVHRPVEPYDCAVGSLFFHHLGDEQILELLARLRSFVRHSVLINDVRRSALTYAGCALISLGVEWNARRDALISIRRGFRAGELEALLGRLSGASVTVSSGLVRIKAVVRFDSNAQHP